MNQTPPAEGHSMRDDGMDAMIIDATDSSASQIKDTTTRWLPSLPELPLPALDQIYEFVMSDDNHPMQVFFTMQSLELASAYPRGQDGKRFSRCLEKASQLKSRLFEGFPGHYDNWSAFPPSESANAAEPLEDSSSLAAMWALSKDIIPHPRLVGHVHAVARPFIRGRGSRESENDSKGVSTAGEIQELIETLPCLLTFTLSAMTKHDLFNLHNMVRMRKSPFSSKLRTLTIDTIFPGSNWSTLKRTPEELILVDAMLSRCNSLEELNVIVPSDSTNPDLYSEDLEFLGGYLRMVPRNCHVKYYYETPHDLQLALSTSCRHIAVPKSVSFRPILSSSSSSHGTMQDLKDAVTKGFENWKKPSQLLKVVKSDWEKASVVFTNTATPYSSNENEVRNSREIAAFIRGLPNAAEGCELEFDLRSGRKGEDAFRSGE